MSPNARIQGRESPIAPVLTSRFLLSPLGMQRLLAVHYGLATFMVLHLGSADG